MYFDLFLLTWRKFDNQVNGQAGKFSDCFFRMISRPEKIQISTGNGVSALRDTLHLCVCVTGQKEKERSGVSCAHDRRDSKC